MPSAGFASSTLRARTSTRGFTLIELIVAMGLLVGLMTMVGTIFKIATEAASKGTATMNVYRYLRSVRQVLKADLENFDPANGALAIYGWEQLAYASQSDQESGRLEQGVNRSKGGDAINSYRPPLDYHRADILMLTNNVESRPFAYRPDNPRDPVPTGNGQIIVYGHADVGTLGPGRRAVPDDDEWLEDKSGNPMIRRIRKGEDTVSSLGIIVGDQPSEIPASHWHLARRAIVTSTFRTSLRPTPLRPSDNLFRLAQSDWAKAYRLGEKNIGEGAPFGDFVDDFDLNEALDIWGSDAFSQPDIPNEWYYNSAVIQDNRTVILESPPAGQQRRLAHHFLPGCMDFKVEVTFDKPEMVFQKNPNIIEPQPPTNWFTIPSGRRVEWVRGEVVGKDDFKTESVTQTASKKFWFDVVGEVYGWTTFTPKLLPGAGTPPDPRNPPFPTAIRITIWIMDRNESLYNPSFDPANGQLISHIGIKEVITHKF